MAGNGISRRGAGAQRKAETMKSMKALKGATGEDTSQWQGVFMAFVSFMVSLVWQIETA